MSPLVATVAVLAGGLIGLSLGALGGGGSILAVPVLVYALGESASQATTGSLVVVGTTALIGAVAAWRGGSVMLGRGAAFAGVAVLGAAAGARAAVHVTEPVLLAAFAVLMLAVGAAMTVRQLRGRGAGPEATAAADEPILTFWPVFSCRCPRALQVVASATAVGLLTGFLGVGGGFLVVPALLLVLNLPMRYAAGTSLVVITITSAVALSVRAGSGAHPDWGVVLLLTAASVAGALTGARVAARTDTRRLAAAFTVLVLAVAVYTAARALPALA